MGGFRGRAVACVGSDEGWTMNAWFWAGFAGFILMAMGFTGYFLERHKWNHGICKANGLRWEYFDTDSQGGRGYKAGDRAMWVSWPGIDGRYQRGG